MPFNDRTSDAVAPEYEESFLGSGDPDSVGRRVDGSHARRRRAPEAKGREGPVSQPLDSYRRSDPQVTLSILEYRRHGAADQALLNRQARRATRVDTKQARYASRYPKITVAIANHCEHRLLGQCRRDRHGLVILYFDKAAIGTDPEFSGRAGEQRIDFLVGQLEIDWHWLALRNLK